MARPAVICALLLVTLAIANGKHLPKGSQRERIKQFVTINGSEYYVDSESWLQFEDAKKDCENRGSRLLSFTSQEKFDELAQWLRSSGLGWQWFWTGGYRDANTNAWKWATSEERINDFLWAPNRPSDQNFQESRCITFSADFRGWDDDRCTGVHLAHICEKC